MIEKSAYFNVLLRRKDLDLICEIVYSDGSKSKLLITKRQAIEIGESQVGICITEEEWAILKQQIISSHMIRASEEVESLLNEIEAEVPLRKIIDDRKQNGPIYKDTEERIMERLKNIFESSE